MRNKGLFIVCLCIVVCIVSSFMLLSGKTVERKEVNKPTSVFVNLEDICVTLEDQNLQKKSKWLDGIFSHLKRKAGFNGTVLYAENGQIVYKGAFGYSDFRKKTPMLIDDKFQLASVSKMFTATAIMILEEEGKLKYDDKVTKHIPDFPYKDVTIRQLLIHRAGLSRYMSLVLEKWENKRIPLHNSDVLSLIKQHQPDPYFKPNRGFHYCNTNYALLANVVESVSNLPFDIFVKERIFVPCGMKNSFVYQMRNDTIVSAYIEGGVNGYKLRRWRKRKVRNDYLNGVMGDKNVYSTVEDLFRFDQALKNNLIISEKTQKEAYTGGSKKKRSDDYGFGWRTRTRRENTIYHFGLWKGFRTFFIRDLAQDKTIIMLTNQNKGPNSSTLWSILDNNKYEEVAPVCNILSPEEDSFLENEDVVEAWFDSIQQISVLNPLRNHEFETNSMNVD